MEREMKQRGRGRGRGREEGKKRFEEEDAGREGGGGRRVRKWEKESRKGEREKERDKVGGKRKSGRGSWGRGMWNGRRSVWKGEARGSEGGGGRRVRVREKEEDLHRLGDGHSQFQPVGVCHALCPGPMRDGDVGDHAGTK
eukprot:756061-Hanusia_phi.AAC.1